MEFNEWAEKNIPNKTVKFIYPMDYDHFEDCLFIYAKKAWIDAKDEGWNEGYEAAKQECGCF